MGFVAIVLALVVLAFILITFAQRECNSNRDCSDNAYCGSDHECHEYPNQIVVKETNYVNAALILGIFLIVAAYIFKGGKITCWKKKKSAAGQLERYKS